MRTYGRIALATGLAIVFAGQAWAAPAAPNAAATGNTNWSAYLGGGDSSQYSPLDQINKDNVRDLKVAWTFEAGEDPPFAFGFRFSPTIVDGVMYVMADGNALVALHADTGQEIWRHKFEGPIGQRGINYWQSKDGKDRRLFVINNGILRAVNATTGEVIQSFGTKRAGADLAQAAAARMPKPGSGAPPMPVFNWADSGVDLRVGLDGIDISKVRPLQTDNPGRVFGDLIIISLPAGAYDYKSAPADIHAYDVRSGKLVWKFHVVPHKGEPAYDSWPEKDHEQSGGAHNWSESTIDEKTGLIFIPTGSARYDWYGGNRHGDNLYGDTLLAIDARTGKLKWHFQTIHHDLWDYDLPTAPKLLTIKRDGKDVDVVIQATKMGWMLVFERTTGKPIWPIVETPVPASDVPGELASPTQPIPKWPLPYARQRFVEEDINPWLPEADKAKLRELLRTSRNEGLFTPPSLRGTILMPSENGGSNWGMVSVDPVNRRFYIVVRNYPSVVKLIPRTRPEDLANMPNADGQVVKPYEGRFDYLLQSNGMVAVGAPFSTIAAYDMDNGNMLYQVPNGDIGVLADKGITGTGSQTPRGGPVVTAGGLMFVGTSSDRKFRARDVATGATLWEHDLPAASEGVPAVYSVGGKQYVVIPSGWDGMFNYGLFRTPAPKTNRYIAFALPDVKTARTGD